MAIHRAEELGELIDRLRARSKCSSTHMTASSMVSLGLIEKVISLCRLAPLRYRCLGGETLQEAQRFT